MKKRINKYLPAIKFTASLIPVSVVAGWFTGLYSIEYVTEEMLSEALAVFGSESMLVLITMAQAVLYAVFCAFFGYILADKVNLIKPFKIEKEALKKTLVYSVVFGIIFSMDYWVFGYFDPMIKIIDEETVTLNMVMAGIFYGGVVEELMMRLFFMSLIAVIVRKLFFKSCDRENIPQKVYFIANLIASIAFAAGHLPATIVYFGSLTPIVLLRCFLLNGGFGFLFGHIYQKYGIQYSMICHALMHVISKGIWFIFI